MSVGHGLFNERSGAGAIKALAVMIIMLMVLLLPLTAPGAAANAAPMGTLTDAPIDIDGEIALAAAASSGDGSFGNPYIIEGLSINASGYANALRIANTNSHLIIRDCEFAYANVGNDDQDKFGLMLEGVSNVTIINVTSYRNDNAGIGIDTSHDVRILDCDLGHNGNPHPASVFPEGGGVRLHFSSDVIVDNCTMVENLNIGVVIETDYISIAIENITISNCSINGSRFGIWSQSNYFLMVNDLTIDNCTISNFWGGGLWLTAGTTPIKQTGWLIKNNVIENGDAHSDRSPIYLNYVTGALITNNEISHTYSNVHCENIDLNHCDNITVSECNIHDNHQVGFQTWYCQNITFQDSLISNITQGGISISNSVDFNIINVSIDAIIDEGVGIVTASRIVIEGCEIMDNGNHGVFVSLGSDHVDISNCTISNNDYGVYLDLQVENVTVVNNTFTGNNGATGTYDVSHIQAYDRGANNSWNDSNGGNRWSDWLGPDTNYDGIVDVPYDIEGAAVSQDLLPLADPEGIPPEVTITAPSDGAVLATTEVTVEWQAWDNQTGLDHIEVTVDSDAPIDVGLNTSIDLSLSEGGHTVTVTAYDAMDNDGSDSVSFSVSLPTVPGTPTGLIVTPSDSAVSLEWNAPPDGGSTITTYHVYRGTDPGLLVDVGNATSPSYDDAGLDNGITYYFAVSAENAIGEGAMSAIVNATPATNPAAPTSLSAEIDGTSISLSWNAPDDPDFCTSLHSLS